MAFLFCETADQWHDEASACGAPDCCRPTRAALSPIVEKHTLQVKLDVLIAAPAGPAPKLLPWFPQPEAPMPRRHPAWSPAFIGSTFAGVFNPNVSTPTGPAF